MQLMSKHSAVNNAASSNIFFNVELRAPVKIKNKQKWTNKVYFGLKPQNCNESKPVLLIGALGTVAFIRTKGR